jgi:predicted O-linked N-acetylglucosamine transferase (SPINDLY family)
LRLLQVEEAQAAYRAGLLRNPNAPRMRSAYLYTYLYVEAPPRQVHAEHVAWARLHGLPLPRPADHPNGRAPERLLHIGLVAPTFSAHAGGIMGRGLIENFNPREIAVTCYSDVTAPDHLTSHYRSRATRWREVLHLDDEGLAAQVRADGIDILVDRTGHAAGSRLGVFARKPAPIQVSYLEYMNTTGLDAIDYWLSDPLATPLTLQPFYTERIWHLERCLGLYSPPPESPPLTPLPAQRNGFVTFAVFNNPLKIQGRTVPMMARVLQALPTARLLFKYGAWERPDVVNRMRDAFARAGIAPDRLTFAGRSSRYGYLQAFGAADIGLDTFPNNGFTTTLESLWMGVPVVSLRGETTVSRIGHSFLTALGRPQWVAAGEDNYVAIALALAADLPALAAIRAGLRNELGRSPLRDGPGHARSLERAFRAMWRIWCAGGGTAGTV